MADITPVSPKTPWHLWVVGGLSLLWNAVGAMDFTLSETRNAAYLKNLTPEQMEYIAGFPAWAVAAWGIATWGSLVGSVLLLCRCRLAYHLFLASCLGMVLTMVYNYILTDELKAMGGGVGSLIFSAVIVVIGILLLVYSRAMRRRGVLRR
jgi:hypothetical protein